MGLIAGICIAIAVGAIVGRGLAQMGMTADNALKKHQRHVYRIGIGALFLGTMISIILITGRQSAWLPAFLILYIAAYFWHGILLGCAVCTGLLMGLELPAWRDRARLQQLILFLIVSCSGIIFLLQQGLPITATLGPPLISEGIVMQTTPSSCAAATIATLARYINPTRTTTEKDVVELARTSKTGTSTLAEIHAMESLGLAPQYARNQTIADLIKRQQPALLHVMEPVGSTTIAHAIALFSIDSAQGSVTLANPLSGKQVRPITDLKDYWIGEAVFVTAPLGRN
jgi:predicted double-glycine peptidase